MNDKNLKKKAIKGVPSLNHIYLIDFFKNMDEAMDEKPSSALNGYNHNEARK